MKRIWFAPYILIPLLSFLLGGQAIRLIQSHAELGNFWSNLRYRQAMQAFNQLEGRAVFVFGASEIESGFIPGEFDQAVRRESNSVRSFNFGFRNMGPDDLAAVIDQMEFARPSNLEIESIYIKFSPSDFTETAQAATRAVQDEVAANIYSREFLIKNLSKDYARYLNILSLQLLQGGYSKVNLDQSLRSLYLQFLTRFTGDNYLVGNPLDFPRYMLWVSPKFNSAPAWNMKNSGYHDRSTGELQKELQALYALQADPEHLQFNFFLQERRSQILSLKIQAQAVTAFATQVARLKHLSNSVSLFYVADHPGLPRDPSAKRRIEQAFQSVCMSAAVRCIRFDQGQEFTPDDYYDAFHLTPEGSKKLSLLLANDYLKNSKH